LGVDVLKRLVFLAIHLILVIFLIFPVSVSLFPLHALGKTGFRDVKETDWFYESVMTLSRAGIINGYPSGDFHPDGSINADAFIKMTVTALGHTDIENGAEYWASTYIDKARELGLVIDGEFNSYTRPICRNEMSRIVIRALDEEYPDNLLAYKSLITDYASIHAGCRDYVVKAYCKGILTGYTDGSFRSENTATRAEAATIIHRLIDPSIRKVPQIPVHPYDELLPALMDDEDFFEYFEDKERFPEYLCPARIDRANKRFVFNDPWQNIEAFVPGEKIVPNLNRKIFNTAKVFTTDDTSFLVAMNNIGDYTDGSAIIPEIVLLRYGWKPKLVADYDPYYYFEYTIFSKDLQESYGCENVFMELIIKRLYSTDDGPIYGDADGLIFQRHVDKLRKSLITLFEYDYSEELFDFIFNEYKEGLNKDMKWYHETGESDYYIRNPIYNSFDFGNIRVYTKFANYLYVFFTYK
jgi:hypothetical protein